MDRKRKSIIIIVGAVVVLLALFALATAIYPLLNSPGVKTEQLDASDAQPATTEIDGEWRVVYGDKPNFSSVGFTFEEILPGEQQVTSGSTNALEGNATIKNETLEAGRVVVDMEQVATDQEKRDINVRSKIFNTNEYPEAVFEVTEPVSLHDVDADANVSEIQVPGELTIKGVTKDVNPTFKVVRSGDQLILSTIININRTDYGVETPDFVAARIAENGEVNVLLTLEK